MTPKRTYNPDRHCGAHPDTENGPCRLFKGWGTDHPGSGRCKLHGGNTKNGQAYAHKEEARRAAAVFGLPVDVDPSTALLEEVHRTAGHVAWLGEQVSATSPQDLIWGVVKHTSGEGPEGPVDVTDEAAVPNVWLTLYQAERKHLVAVCAAALKAGVEERRVKLAEAQGSMLASVIRAVLDDLGLSADQQAMVAEVVPRHLRAVTG